MAQQIVNAYNFFVDSGRALQVDSKGDDIKLALNHYPISCGDNQYIRMSVQHFQMYKSWYNINSNNNKFRINGTQSFPAGSNVALSNTLANNSYTIPIGNYATMYELALAFATSAGEAIGTWTGMTNIGANVYSSINPLSGQNLEGTGTNHIEFIVTFASTHGITVANLNLQTQVEDGDSYELLGGVRIRDLTDLTTGSCTITAPTTSSLKFVMPFNCQLTTINSVYLKTDMSTTNVGTITYLSRNTDDVSSSDQIIQSRILCKIIPDIEFATFTTNTNLEYFVNLSQKTLTHISLRLTDNHDRQIPLISNGAIATTYPSNVRGNRSFEAVIKFEIIEYLDRKGQLQTLAIPHELNPKMDAQIFQLRENDDSLINIDKMIKSKLNKSKINQIN
jgi:hypothetical protein